MQLIAHIIAAILILANSHVANAGEPGGACSIIVHAST